MIRSSFLFCCLLSPFFLYGQAIKDNYGVVIRSDTTEKNIYLCFTGHDFYEGFEHVLKVLEQQEIEASFFLTGDFVRSHPDLIKRMDLSGHFIGAHSDKHLLYCDWSKRDSLLHSKEEIELDIKNNLNALNKLAIYPKYFMPPYEWYNQAVVDITNAIDQVTVNFSPGTRSNADYTTPDMKNYIKSKTILKSIYRYEKKHGMNGFHLLIHPGTSPLRKDKLYLHLEDIIVKMRKKGYQFKRF